MSKDDMDTSLPLSASNAGMGFLAMCASFLLPGLGQWISGRRRRGACWLAVWAVAAVVSLSSTYVRGGVVVCLVALIAWSMSPLLAAIDAFVRGRRAGQSILRWPLVRYLVGIGLVLIAITLAEINAKVIEHEWIKAYAIVQPYLSPPLHPGDLIIVFRHYPIHRWDYVICTLPTDDGREFVTRRIIGLPNESIQIGAAGLKINGSTTPWPPGVAPWTTFGEGNSVHLGADEYLLIVGNYKQFEIFVDPLATPQPGRSPAVTPSADINGVGVVVYWPFRDFKLLPECAP